MTSHRNMHRRAATEKAQAARREAKKYGYSEIEAGMTRTVRKGSIGRRMANALNLTRRGGRIRQRRLAGGLTRAQRSR